MFSSFIVLHRNGISTNVQNSLGNKVEISSIGLQAGVRRAGSACKISSRAEHGIDFSKVGLTIDLTTAEGETKATSEATTTGGTTGFGGTTTAISRIRTEIGMTTGTEAEVATTGHRRSEEAVEETGFGETSVSSVAVVDFRHALLCL